MVNQINDAKQRPKGKCLARCVEAIFPETNPVPDFASYPDWIGMLYKHLDNYDIGVLVEIPQDNSYPVDAEDDHGQELPNTDPKPQVFTLHELAGAGFKQIPQVMFGALAIAIHAHDGAKEGHAVVWMIDPPTMLPDGYSGEFLDSVTASIPRLVYDPAGDQHSPQLIATRMANNNMPMQLRCDQNNDVYNRHGPQVAWFRFWTVNV